MDEKSTNYSEPDSRLGANRDETRKISSSTYTGATAGPQDNDYSRVDQKKEEQNAYVVQQTAGRPNPQNNSGRGSFRGKRGAKRDETRKINSSTSTGATAGPQGNDYSRVDQKKEEQNAYSVQQTAGRPNPQNNSGRGSFRGKRGAKRDETRKINNSTSTGATAGPQGNDYSRVDQKKEEQNAYSVQQTAGRPNPQNNSGRGFFRGKRGAKRDETRKINSSTSTGATAGLQGNDYSRMDQKKEEQNAYSVQQTAGRPNLQNNFFSNSGHSSVLMQNALPSNMPVSQSGPSSLINSAQRDANKPQQRMDIDNHGIGHSARQEASQCGLTGINTEVNRSANNSDIQQDDDANISQTEEPLVKTEQLHDSGAVNGQQSQAVNQQALTEYSPDHTEIKPMDYETTGDSNNDHMGTDSYGWIPPGVDPTLGNDQSVYFIVVAAPSLKMYKNNRMLGIEFGNEQLGGWKNVRYVMQKVKRFEDSYVLCALCVPLPRNVRTTDYKYVILKDPNSKRSQKKLYEKLHCARYGDPDRTMKIPDNFTGNWFQMDGCCHPPKLDNRNYVAQIWDGVKNIAKMKPTFDLKELLSYDYIRAWHYLMPTLEVMQKSASFCYHFDFYAASNPKDGVVPMNDLDAATVIASTICTYTNVFEDNTIILKMQQLIQLEYIYFKEITDRLTNQIQNLLPQERVSLAMAILNSLYCQYTKKPIPCVRLTTVHKETLNTLCRLMSVDDSRKGNEILSDWFDEELRTKRNCSDPLTMLGWLARTVDFHPVIISFLPLCHFATKVQLVTSDYRDSRWWLPETFVASTSKYIPFPARNDFEHAFQCIIQKKHYVDIDLKFIGCILRLYCRYPKNVCQVINMFSQYKVEQTFAWCVLYFEHYAYRDRAFENYWEDIATIFDHLTETFLSSLANSHLWINDKGKFPIGAEMMVSILRSCHHDHINNTMLASILRLMSAIETRIQKSNGTLPGQLIDSVKAFLASEQLGYLTPRYVQNAKVARQLLLETFCMKINGNETKKLWLMRCLLILDQWKHVDICVQAILQLCGSSDLELIDSYLQDHLINVASDVACQRLQMSNDCRKTCNYLKQFLRDGPGYQALFSSIIQTCYPNEINQCANSIDVLKFIIKWPMAEIYLDQGLIDGTVLNDTAQQLLLSTRDHVTKAWTICKKGAVTIDFVSFMNGNKNRLSSILQLSECTNFGDVISNLNSAATNFSMHMSQLKTLKNCLTPAYKFQNYADFFALLEQSERDQIISEICEIDLMGKFRLKYQLSDAVKSMVSFLLPISHNVIFNQYWTTTLNAQRTPISIYEVPDKVLLPVQKNVQLFLDSLHQLSLTLLETQEFLDTLEQCKSKERVIEELCLRFGSNEWLHESFRRIEIYQQLKQCRVVHHALKTLVKSLELQQCKKDLDQILIMQREDAKLMDVNEALLHTCQQISSFSDIQTKLLVALSNSMSFIKWARKFIDDPQFQRFLNLVTPAAGESDREIEIITAASKIVPLCQTIIFGLSPDLRLTDFLEVLQPIWEHLETDELFIPRLEQMSTDWKKLEELEDSRLDFEKSNIKQAKKINECGIVEVGCLDMDKSIDNCIRIQVPKDNAANDRQENKVYSPHELRDLHSRLTLIGLQVGNTDEAKDEIDAFDNLYKETLRLATAYQQHHKAGNVLLSNWHCSFYNNCINRPFYAEADLGYGLPMLTSSTDQEKPPILDEIKALCKTLEKAMGEWYSYVNDTRHAYPILNNYTNSQIEFLRRKLATAVISDHDTPLDTESKMMLMAIKKDVRKEDVANAIREFLLEEQVEDHHINEMASAHQETEAEEREDFLRQVENIGISRQLAIRAAEEVNYKDVDEAINWATKNQDQEDKDDDANAQVNVTFDMQGASFKDKILQQIERLGMNHTGLLANKIGHIWHAHMHLHEGNSFLEFISLKCLGYVLDVLAKKSKKEVTDTLLNNLALKLNEPNLLLTNMEEVYRFLISIYDCYTRPPSRSSQQVIANELGQLPNFDQVFICRSTTTEEEIFLFIKRIYYQPGSGIFSIVDVQNLNAEAAHELEISVNNLMYSIKEFHLLIFGARENFEKSPTADGLLRFQRVLENPISRVESCRFVTKKLAKDGWNGNFDNLGPEIMSLQFKANVVTSIGYGHGKSLCIQRQYDALKSQIPEVLYVKIPLHDISINVDLLYEMLNKSETTSIKQAPRFFHFDIINHQTQNVDMLLFQLFILGGFTTSNGRVWRILDDDKYVIEITSAPNNFLQPDLPDEATTPLSLRFLFPVVLCHSPTSTLRNLTEECCLRNSAIVSRYCDYNWLCDHYVQRCFWYLSNAYERTNDNFDPAQHAKADEKSILMTFLDACGIPNPSWFELENYAQFLNQQLFSCENSIFCNPSLAEDLPGFRVFAVKFMKFMARDIATRSLKIAEDVSNLQQERFQEVEAYQQKHRWEHQAHPYIFFNSDGQSMSFLGCYFNQKGDLIDSHSLEIYPGGRQMASPNLLKGLQRNGVNLCESFNEKKCKNCKKGNTNTIGLQYCDECRREKLIVLCRVLGVRDPTVASALKPQEEGPLNYNPDPDRNYEITADCAMKILAIKMRLNCGIPVVLMGETGCGKTKLIEYMCGLEREGCSDLKNLLLLRMHGGVTKQRIALVFNEALELAKTNWATYEKSTYLFFDEANTTPDINFLKEIICDDSMNGLILKARQNHLYIVAAVNPYRKHDEAMIKRFESSGLGYHISEKNVQQTFGKIPLRHLVYRVEPLSPSLIPFVIDFGSLSNETESTYIQRMFDRFLQRLIDKFKGWTQSTEDESKVYKLLAGVHSWMKDQKDETSFVSLRNIDRAFKVAEWFLMRSELLLAKTQKREALNISNLMRSVLLAVCFCYRVSLLEEKRAQLDAYLLKLLDFPYFGDNRDITVIQIEVDACQDVFLDAIHLPNNVAKNAALKENLFLMTLCIELRIPLFLIGRPGSSKSLAKTIIEENMQGTYSKSSVYKSLKLARVISFQCSPLARAEDIESIFRDAAIYQKDRDLDKEAAVVVADEVGLAEDTLALKSLHGLLEEGAKIKDENLSAYHKPAFVGISNWALDPAKMNRGIFVIRPIPGSKELKETARVICYADNKNDKRIEALIDPMVRAYMEVYFKRREEKEELEFFGLRDFYCLMKMIADIAKQEPDRHDLYGNVYPLPYKQVMRAIQHNFSGQEDNRTHGILFIFQKELADVLEVEHLPFIKPTTLIHENLIGYPSNQRLNRYLLVLTKNNAALPLIRQIETLYNADVIVGSAFPNDLEYTQVCKNINKIKVAMDKGKAIILLNLDSLYESLYDLLNQSFIPCGGKNFVNLGLGMHRLQCHVHPNFRLAVVAEREKAIREFPAPLINRLEKHYLFLKSELDEKQLYVVEQLKEWVKNFVSTNCAEVISSQNAFIGYNEDTLAALVIDTVHKIESAWSCEDLFQAVQWKLIQCATPEAILRLPLTDLSQEAEDLQNMYFREQIHSSFKEYFGNVIETSDYRCLIQITTHSRLLSHLDKPRICKDFNLAIEQIHLLNLHMYNTEQEFLDALEKIYKTSIKTNIMQHIIIQCGYQEKDAALVNSCCFSLEKHFIDYPDCHIQIYLICSLPRKKGGCFISFQTGIWECIHIDQLVEAAQNEDSVDLLAMRNKSISTLFQEYLEDFKAKKEAERENKNVGNIETNDMEEPEENFPIELITENEVNNVFNFQPLLVDCLQLAAAKIRDQSHRKLERASILIQLFSEDGNFERIICQRLLKLLKEYERTMRNLPEAWMLNQVDNLAFIFENSTYVQSIRKIMELDITPLLAGLISIVDAGDNLSLLFENESKWIRPLWFQLFEDESFLEVQYDTNSTLYFEKDGTGFLHRKMEFAVNLPTPFQTPFFLLISEKILRSMRSMGLASEHLSLVEKVRAVTNYLTQATTWFINLLPIFNEPEFVQRYLSDIICQNYPADPVLIELLTQWLEQDIKNGQYFPAVIGAQFAHENLSNRMRWAIELVKLAPEAMTYKEISEVALENLNFEIDLYVAQQICEYLSSKVPKLDYVTLIMEQVKEERANWLALASRLAPLMKQVLFKRDKRPAAYQDINNQWFCVEFCHSFLEQVQTSNYLFKAAPIWDLASRNSNGLSKVKFWQTLESSLIMMNKSMIQYYKKQNSLLDNSTRAALIMFFMDVVYEAFSNQGTANANPDVNVVKFLLKYTAPKEFATLIPFFTKDEQCDYSAIFRSFILQIICCHNLNEVLEHIDDCLQQMLDNGEQNRQALNEFAATCIYSIEDSYYTLLAPTAENAYESNMSEILHQVNTFPQTNDFWNRLLRNETTTAADLCTLAKIRFILGLFADLVHKRSVNKFKNMETWQSVVDCVKRLITNSNHPSARLLLIKYICRHYSRELLEYCAKNTGALDWIIDGNMFTNVGIPDPFLIYGPTYLNVKNQMHDALFHEDDQRFDRAISQVDDINQSLVPLTILLAMKQLEQLVMTKSSTADLISNRLGQNAIVGRCLERINATINGEMATFIWHAISVTTHLPSTGLAEFFKDLMANPQACKEILFPTMDDDLRSIVQVTGSQQIWYCPNGHRYLIENCGRPYIWDETEGVKLCNECRVPIGGRLHVPFAGNRPVENMKHVQTGHILGCAGSFVQTGQRKLTRTTVLIMRCLTHALMFGSALMNGNNLIAELITPPIENESVLQFLKDHLEQDFNMLAHSFACSVDDVFLVMHQMLRHWVESHGVASGKLELRTQDQRAIWEDTFVNKILKHVTQHYQLLIEEGRNAISGDAGDPFWRMVFLDTSTAEDLSSHLWSYRPQSTLQSLTDQAMSCLDACDLPILKRLEVLRLFLTKMHQLSALRHLLTIRELHQRLNAHFHGCISIRYAQKTTIDEFLKTLHEDIAGIYKPMIDSFFDAYLRIMPSEQNELLMRECTGNYYQLPLSIILPFPKLTNDPPFYNRDLQQTLARLQNDLLDATSLGNKLNKCVHYKNLTSVQVINFDSNRQGLKLLMLHQLFDGVHGNEQTSSNRVGVRFDLDLLQRRVQRFILSATVNINPGFPLMRAKEAVILECLKRLRDLGAKDLTLTQKREIFGVLRINLPKTKEILDHLEMMIRFSWPLEKQAMDSLPLNEFLKQFKPAANHKLILKGYTVSHLVPLWQLTAFLVKWLLVERNIEDPFGDLDDKFKEKLSDQLRAQFEMCLSGIDVLQFVFESTEFLLLDMQPGCNSAIERWATLNIDDLLAQPLNDYLKYRSGSSLPEDFNLPGQVLVKHVVDVWNIAAAMQSQHLR